jgi:hypothetical protein
MEIKTAAVAGKYSDITLGEYVAYKKAGISEIMKLQAVTGLSKQDALKVSSDKAAFALAKFEDALNNPSAPQALFKIELGGKDYGFIPDLSKITLGNKVDIMTNVESGDLANWPKVMAMLYRPIIANLGSKYEIEPYDIDKVHDRAELFKTLPLPVADGALLFFSTISNELSVNLQLSLVRQMRKEMNEPTEKKRWLRAWRSGGGFFLSRKCAGGI